LLTIILSFDNFQFKLYTLINIDAFLEPKFIFNLKIIRDRSSNSIFTIISFEIVSY
jgi:hypothetical protein